jgi:uncharacterized membrane protein
VATIETGNRDSRTGRGYNGSGDSLARGLGWLTLGLGIADAAAPRPVIRLLALDDTPRLRALFRLVGERELGQAAGLLISHDPRQWVWSRVAGDAIDLAVLGRAMANGRGQPRFRTALATAGVAALGIVDVYAALTSMGSDPASDAAIQLDRSITINRPPSDAFSFWRNFANLPRFIPRLERVDVLDDLRSHWSVKAPVGHWTWDAEITGEEPDRFIAWRSITGVPNSGEVTFLPAPGERGTEVRAKLSYRLPGGPVGDALAWVAGEQPDQLLRDALRRLKQLLESGEMIVADEQVSARGPLQHGVTRLLRRRMALGGRP